MLTVALIMGMSQIFLSVATNIWQITILNIVVGAFWAGGNLAVPVLLGSWFSKKRGIVFGLILGSSSLGKLMFIPLFADLQLLNSWRMTYVVFGTVILIVGLAATAFLVKNQVGDLGSRGKNGARGLRRQGKIIDKTLRAMKDRSFFLIIFSHFVCGLGCGFVLTHFVAFASDIGISNATAVNTFAIMNGVAIFGCLLMSQISDMVGSISSLIITYLFRGVSFIIPLTGINSISMFYSFAVCFGVTNLATYPLISLLIEERYDHSTTGLILGWTLMAHSVGSALSSYAGGAIFDFTSSYFLTFLLMIPPTFIVAISFHLTRNKPRKNNHK